MKWRWCHRNPNITENLEEIVIGVWYWCKSVTCIMYKTRYPRQVLLVSYMKDEFGSKSLIQIPNMPARTWNQSQMKDESWSKSLIKISTMPDENHEINFHRPNGSGSTVAHDHNLPKQTSNNLISQLTPQQKEEIGSHTQSLKIPKYPGLVRVFLEL